MLFGLDLGNLIWRESELGICTVVFGQSTSLLKNVGVSHLNFSNINLQLPFLLSLSPLYNLMVLAIQGELLKCLKTRQNSPVTSVLTPA